MTETPIALGVKQEASPAHWLEERMLAFHSLDPAEKERARQWRSSQRWRHISVYEWPGLHCRGLCDDS